MPLILPIWNSAIIYYSQQIRGNNFVNCRWTPRISPGPSPHFATLIKSLPIHHAICDRHLLDTIHTVTDEMQCNSCIQIAHGRRCCVSQYRDTWWVYGCIDQWLPKFGCWCINTMWSRNAGSSVKNISSQSNSWRATSSKHFNTRSHFIFRCILEDGYRHHSDGERKIVLSILYSFCWRNFANSKSEPGS